MIYEYNLKSDLLSINKIVKYTVKQRSFIEVKSLTN